MNCDECKELLVLDVEGLLEEAQKQAVAKHLAGCEACRAEREGLGTLQQRLVANGKAAAQTSVEEDVMNRIIREQSARLKTAAQAGASLRLRRFLMKSPTTRVAAAAVVVVACAIGLSMWKGTGSIALADVVAKVEQIQAYIFRTSTTVEDQTRGGHTAESTTLVSSEYGMRTDRTTVHAADGKETELRTYVLPRDKSVVLVNVSEKQYGRVGMDDLTWENMKVENRDPREMLKRLLACEYRELGTSVIDGMKTQGFETTDPSYLGDTERNVSARVWVAVDTWLPVRYELELDLREGVHLSTVQDGYEWGVLFDGSEFEPDIPADFTTHEADGMQMPSYSEQGMIEAFQVVADFTGRYPASLNSEAVRQLSMDLARAAKVGETPAARQFQEQIKNAGSREAAIRLGQSHFMKIAVFKVFTRMLAERQAEPVYHGNVVTPEDAESPLMRWKVSDGEYRVIFGDLRVETVGADVLAELEAALPQ